MTDGKFMARMDTGHNTEELLRLFVEYTPAAVAMFDCEMNLLIGSRKWFETYAIKADEMQDHVPDEVFPEMAERWNVINQRVLAGEVQRSEEELFPRVDGSQEWVRWEIRPWYDSHGEVGGSVMLIDPIAEQRKVEERTQALLGAIPDMMFRLDQDGVFLDFKAERGAELVASPDMFLGKQVSEVLPPSVSQPTMLHLELALTSGEMQTFEYSLQLPDGNVQDYEVRLMPGGTEEATAIVRNITERRQAQMTEQRLLEVIEQSGDFVSTADLEGKIIYMNETGRNMLGISPDQDLAELTIPDVHPAWAAEIVEKQGLPAAMEKGWWRGETALRGADGQEVLVSQTIVTHRGPDGQIQYLSTIAQDITERQRALERRERQVRLTTQVAQALVAETNLEDLYLRVVTEVKEQLGYYYVQILRYKPENKSVALVAGYGDTGRQMLKEGHQMTLGAGLIGQAAESGQPVLVADVANDPEWQANPLLPDTRAEMAVPIMLSDRLLGVLDVQSSQAGGFDADDQLMLEGLCGQIAMAIESTRLLEEANIFRQFVETSMQGIGWVDLNGHVVYTNPALRKMVGKPSLEAMAGQDLRVYYPEELRPRFDTEIIPTVMREGLWSGELALVTENGQITPTYETFFLVNDDAGRPQAICDLITDISERKRSEAEMEDRMRELNALYRSTSQQGWQSFQSVTQQLSGYLFDGLDVHQADSAEATVVGSDGAFIDELSVHGQQIGMLAIESDPSRPLTPEEQRLIEQVSEQVALALDSARLFEQMKASEEALRQREGQLAEALNVANLAYWEFDVATQHFIFNDDWFRLFRTSVEEQGGYEMPAEEFARKFNPAEAATAVAETLGTVLQTDDPDYLFEQETPVIFGDGERGWVMLRIRVQLDDNSQVSKLYGTNQDITARKETEAVVAKRAAELSTVAQVSTTVATILDPNQILQTVVDLTQENFDLYHAHIYLVNASGDKLYLAAGAGDVGRLMVEQGWEIPFTREKSLVAQAARTREGVVSNDVRADIGYLPNPLLPDTYAEMAIPLIAGDRVLGVLDVQADTVDRFTEEDVRIQTTLAAQVAVALQNAYTYAQAQRQAEHEALINAISQKIQTTTTVEKALQVAVRELGRALDAPRTSVMLSLNQNGNGQRSKNG